MSNSGKGNSHYNREGLLREVVERSARGPYRGSPTPREGVDITSPTTLPEAISTRKLNSVRFYNVLEHLEGICVENGINYEEFRRLFKARTLGGQVYLVANELDQQIDFRRMTPKRASQIARKHGAQYGSRLVGKVQVHFFYRLPQGTASAEQEGSSEEEPSHLRTHQDREVSLIQTGSNFTTFPEFLNFLASSH